MFELSSFRSGSFVRFFFRIFFEETLLAICKVFESDVSVVTDDKKLSSLLSTGKQVKKFIDISSAEYIHGINIIKKHEKTTKEKKGGIISKENFIHLSNLKNLDTKDKINKSEDKK